MVTFFARISYRCLLRPLHNHDTGFQAFYFTVANRSENGI